MFKWWVKNLFDFSEQVPQHRKILHIWLALGVDLVWTAYMTLFLALVFNTPLNDIKNLISSNIAIDFMEKFKLTADLRLNFFVACVLAPLWEETVFRYWPIYIGQFAKKLAEHVSIKGSLVLPMVLISSIIFGILHGSVLNILFQGFGGLVFSWLYLKNNNSFWSVVAVHAIWNFCIVIGTAAIL